MDTLLVTAETTSKNSFSKVAWYCHHHALLWWYLNKISKLVWSKHLPKHALGCSNVSYTNSFLPLRTHFRWLLQSLKGSRKKQLMGVFDVLVKRKCKQSSDLGCMQQSEAISEAPAWVQDPSSAGDVQIKWPACQPRRPVAARATASRSLERRHNPDKCIPVNIAAMPF